MHGKCPVEPFSERFLVDPHPTYDHLREHDPVRPVVMPTGERAWLVSKYEDIRQGLSDGRLSNDQTRLKIIRPFSDLPAETERAMTTDLLSIDPPAHSRLRGVIAAYFTAQRAEDFRVRLRDIADDLLDELGERDVIDVVADFAAPFAARATAELMGVPPRHHTRFRRWGNEIASAILKTRDDALLEPALELHGFVGDLIESKRAEPADDPLTALVQAFDRGDLNPDELTSMVQLLLIAGQEGPVNLIGNGTYLLLTHPGQLARLRAEPGLLASAVEEFLRLEAPLGLSIYRSADEPITFSGVTIPAGEPILFSFLSSGHDEDRFAPRLDIGGAARHLGFGWGRHYCLGAPHGRVEVQVAIGALVLRHPNLRLAVPAADVEWRPSVVTRGPSALPVGLR